jgi:hypothetical protein
MRTRIWSGTCTAIAFGLTVGLMAQQPPQTQPPAQSSSAKSVTVTGCIQRAEQAPTGTSGAAGATRSTSETRFLLTSAAIGTSATGTAGTTTPSTAVASEYRLDADDAKLTPHVGHKVEIAGTVEPPASRTESPAASAANAPKLKVDTVKMIASTCP